MQTLILLTSCSLVAMALGALLSWWTFAGSIGKRQIKKRDAMIADRDLQNLAIAVDRSRRSAKAAVTRKRNKAAKRDRQKTLDINALLGV